MCRVTLHSAAWGNLARTAGHQLVVCQGLWDAAELQRLQLQPVGSSAAQVGHQRFCFCALLPVWHRVKES